jgi:nucleotide-binding universal stress UspA family protein
MQRPLTLAPPRFLCETAQRAGRIRTPGARPAPDAAARPTFVWALCPAVIKQFGAVARRQSQLRDVGTDLAPRLAVPTGTLSSESKEHAMCTLQCILHPTDFSERSQFAFQLACELARDHRARLVLLHVLELPLDVYNDGMLLPVSPGTEERARQGLLNMRPTQPGLKVERHLARGNPTEEILRLAQQCKCDLIVMGTHGRSGLGRLLLGSVAELVLRKAACPVLTVKEPPTVPVAAAAGKELEAAR